MSKRERGGVWYVAMALVVIGTTGWILSCSGGGSSARAACQRLCECGSFGSSTGADSCNLTCAGFSSSEPVSSSGDGYAACYQCISSASCSELQSSGACAAECGSTGLPFP
jgi:hypothetical protein